MQDAAGRLVQAKGQRLFGHRAGGPAFGAAGGAHGGRPDDQHAVQYCGPHLHWPYPGGRRVGPDRPGGVHAADHDRFGLCGAGKQRGRAARLHLFGPGGRGLGRKDPGQLLCGAGGGFGPAHGDIAGLWAGAAAGLWRKRKYHRLRGQLHEHLRPGHGVCAAYPGHERLYHGPGLCQNRHALGAHRGGVQHPAGPCVHLCVWDGGAGRGAGHRALAGGLLLLGAELFAGQKDPFAAAPGLHAARAPDPPAGAGAGAGRLYHAGQREHPLGLL